MPLGIDLQFDRAVSIVQQLPKDGPIKTNYEEKLNMYSLFKQATEGNVKGSRPGILNMLERSKYDAWATMKDIPTSEAKFLYCESLKKILKKYSDKPISLELLSKLRKPLDEDYSTSTSSSSLETEDDDFRGLPSVIESDPQTHQRFRYNIPWESTNSLPQTTKNHYSFNNQHHIPNKLISPLTPLPLPMTNNDINNDNTNEEFKNIKQKLNLIECKVNELYKKLVLNDTVENDYNKLKLKFNCLSLITFIGLLIYLNNNKNFIRFWLKLKLKSFINEKH